VREKLGLGEQRHFPAWRKKTKAADLWLINSANDAIKSLTGQISDKRQLLRKRKINRRNDLLVP